MEIFTFLKNDQKAQQLAIQKIEATIQEVSQRDNTSKQTSVKLLDAGSVISSVSTRRTQQWVNSCTKALFEGDSVQSAVNNDLNTKHKIMSVKKGGR